MMQQVRGTRPRPRVAILGEVSEEQEEYFKKLFPTTWIADRGYRLQEMVDYREIDLTIIMANYSYEMYGGTHRLDEYLVHSHIICFSNILELPGPVDGLPIHCKKKADTESYYFPEIPIELNRQRERDFANVTNIRGNNGIDSVYEKFAHYLDVDEKEFGELFTKTGNVLTNGAIVLEQSTNLPLAVMYLRESVNLHVCVLPNEMFSIQWVDLLCNQWAKYHPDQFPNFGNWQKMPEWMTQQEISLAREIEKVEAQKEKANREFALKLAELSAEQISLAESSNKGLRKLITAQGRELVDEVVSVFRELGFDVQVIDDEIDSENSKLEDLRLTIPDEKNWEAIVEVRGYTRSSGQTQDFQRLARFATHFLKEKGKLPDKRILVVNGETEILNPSNRQLPYSAAKNDLEAFAEDDGIVIWSLDLFRQVNRIGEVPIDQLRKSIMESKGRWQGYHLD